MDGEEKTDTSEVNRREFLKLAGAGIGAAALPDPAQERSAVPNTGIPWDRETEILVIGSGYAGLSAAIEAHDSGAAVAVIEKMSRIGGNSVTAGGTFNAVDPPRQGALGIQDSIDLHFQQTLEGGEYRGHPAKVRYLVEHALEGWMWLEGMGVQLVRLFEVYGALYPRSHQPAYRGKAAGAAIIDALQEQLARRRIPLLLDTTVTRIYREHPLEGRVLGVQVQSGDEKLNFRAGKGVILASGGFCADVGLRMRYDPRWTGKFATTSHPGATGEILIMAQDIGASTSGMDYVQSIGPAGPDARYSNGGSRTAEIGGGAMGFIGGLSVNFCLYTDLRGTRIIASDASRADITDAVMRTPEQVCVVIGDAVSREKTGFDPIPLEKIDRLIKERPREFYKADTVKELARRIRMPDPKILEDAVGQYNTYVDAKKDPDFGQRPHNLIWKCETPPFFAVSASPSPHYTCGGIRTQAPSTQVLDRWDRVIPGLYAAGEVTGGVHGTNRLGGNGTTDCIVFGRLAGREAAVEKI